MSQVFKVLWLNAEGETIDFDFKVATSQADAMRLLGLRMYRGAHSIPDNAAGFRLDRITDPDILHEAET